MYDNNSVYTLNLRLYMICSLCIHAIKFDPDMAKRLLPESLQNITIHVVPTTGSVTLQSIMHVEHVYITHITHW